MALPKTALFKFACTAAFVFFLGRAQCSANLIWLYDFPGTPGSALGNGQTNPQSPNVTFSDWSRVSVSAVGTANVLDSNLWNVSSTFDSTQYESFTITAASGYHLNLQSLVFDEMRSSGGPTKGRVQLFLNGSTTAYNAFDFNPGASFQTKTDGFTPTTDADNVTTAEFRFYGWNGGTSAASLVLDNVTINVAVVPETATLGPVSLLVGCLAAGAIRRRMTKPA